MKNEEKKNPLFEAEMTAFDYAVEQATYAVEAYGEFIDAMSKKDFLRAATRLWYAKESAVFAAADFECAETAASLESARIFYRTRAAESRAAAAAYSRGLEVLEGAGFEAV